MLIHQIIKFPYKRVDPTKEFGGKIKEKELVDRMKTEFGLVKKSRRFSIHSIAGQAV